MGKIRSIIEEEICKNGLSTENPRANSILTHCDQLTKMDGFYVEGVSCRINNNTLTLMVGTYYAEIDGINHPIYNVFNKADHLEMYAVDKNNPDGAMYVFKMTFNNVWTEA